MSDRPLDPGLQLERTLLAWRRTALALVVAGLLLVRISLPDAAPAAALGLSCVGFGAAASVLATRRYRRRHESGLAALSGGGGLVAVMGAGVAAAGIGCAVWAVSSAL